MPSRIVREGINSSPRVNQLSMGAEVFYRRLMSVVDDYGRYHGSVVTLRGACWPTNPEKIREREVAKWLDELLKGDDPLVRTYEVLGAIYVEIQDFGQQTRTKSRFPDPPCGKIDSKVPAECQQIDSRIPENDCTSRSRISKSKSKSESEHAPSRVPPVEILEPAGVLQSRPKPPSMAEAWEGFDFEEWFQERMRMHPNKLHARHAATLLSGHSRITEEDWRVEFERVHGLWLRSELWTWKNGARVPPMDQLVIDEFWLYPPTESKTRTQRAMEAL